MERTRVILVEMPRMLCEIVREVLSDEPDLDIIDECGRDAGAILLGDGDRCVVITRLAECSPESVRRLFGPPQRVRLLALSPDGRSGTIYELQTRERKLDELSPTSLLAAVREPLP